MLRHGLLLPLGMIALACNARPPPIDAVPPPPALSSTAVASAPLASASPAPSLPVEPVDPASARPAPSASGKLEHRCGWVDNPTPSNWWITDRDGTWEIGVQGGYQARGEMPDFGTKWVETNGHYGYGCACMDVRLDRATTRVIEYRDVKTLPIERCRKDKKLPPRGSDALP